MEWLPETIRISRPTHGCATTMSNSPRKSENKSKNWDNNKYKYKRNQSCACVQAFQRIKRPAASSQTDKISEADQREFWETRNERIYVLLPPSAASSALPVAWSDSNVTQHSSLLLHPSSIANEPRNRRNPKNKCRAQRHSRRYRRRHFRAYRSGTDPPASTFNHKKKNCWNVDMHNNTHISCGKNNFGCFLPFEYFHFSFLSFLFWCPVEITAQARTYFALVALQLHDTHSLSLPSPRFHWTWPCWQCLSISVSDLDPVTSCALAAAACDPTLLLSSTPNGAGVVVVVRPCVNTPQHLRAVQE